MLLGYKTKAIYMSHLGKLTPFRIESLTKFSDYSFYRNLEGFIMSEIILRETSSLVVTSSLGNYSNIKRKINISAVVMKSNGIGGDSQLIAI